MDALGNLLDSVLSDPEKMSQIGSLAEQLGLALPASEQAAPQPDAIEHAQLLSSFLHLAEQAKQDPRQVQLLTALRPFLRPERQAALDRAMKAAQLSSLAALALRTLREKGPEDLLGV